MSKEVWQDAINNPNLNIAVGPKESVRTWCKMLVQLCKTCYSKEHLTQLCPGPQECINCGSNSHSKCDKIRCINCVKELKSNLSKYLPNEIRGKLKRDIPLPAYLEAQIAHRPSDRAECPAIKNLLWLQEELTRRHPEKEVPFYWAQSKPGQDFIEITQDPNRARPLRQCSPQSPTSPKL